MIDAKKEKKNRKTEKTEKSDLFLKLKTTSSIPNLKRKYPILLKDYLMHP